MKRWDLSRYMLANYAVAALLAACGGSQPPIAAPRTTTDIFDSLPHHRTFLYTGKRQSFKVPAGVRSITVVARGAAGDGGTDSTSGHYYEYFGRGGRVYAIVPVRSGETLYVFVGGRGEGSYQGGNGFNGGGLGGEYPNCKGDYCYGYGGGGASDVREAAIQLAIGFSLRAAVAEREQPESVLAEAAVAA